MILTISEKKKRLQALVTALLLVILSICLDMTGIVELPERKTIDIRTRLTRMNKALSPDIAIILVDESSIDAMNDVLGRWPWPRYIHGELINFLAQCGAESIVMDITFFSNQKNEKSPESSLDPSDKALADATRAAHNVIHAVEFTNDPPDEFNRTILDHPLPMDVIRRFSLNVQAESPIPGNNVYYLPFKEVLDASAGIGVVSFSKDADTVSRSEHLIFNYQGHCFPTHALAPVLRRVGSDAIRIRGNTAFIQSTGKPDIAVPLNRDGEYYANMYGRYNTYSYSGVIQSMMKLQQGITDGLMVRPEEFAGKIIYVGTSAAATQDQKNTSIGNDVPGVFLHASICGNILDHDVLDFIPFYARCLIMAGLIVSSVFLVLFLKSNTLKINVPIAAALAYGVLSVIFFSKNLVIPVALPLTVMVIAYFASFMIITFTEGKEKRKVKNILGQYVSPAMLSMVLENSKEEYLKAEVGTKENLTIFFSDIRGFTSISERYPVEKVVEALNAYLSMMVDIIFDNSGTLDKFIGDAIMAFWGAPVRFDDHPYKAVLSAIRMVQAMNRLNLENKDKALPELKIGIGIHTDLVILGNIGSRKKLDYTVIGDGVNLTSRLEGLTKTYASEILISQSTYDHVKDTVCCRIADFVKVKGKDEPLVIYQVRGLEHEVPPWDRTLAEKTREGFDLYRSGYFKAAKAIYDEILQTDPDDGLARLFSDRCDELIRTVPSDGWDGCYVHKSK